MSHHQDKMTMTVLAAGDLDIDELERRLELATATAAAEDWCSGVAGCQANVQFPKSYTGP